MGLTKLGGENNSTQDKPAAIFDIDETSLSNWDAILGCSFCSYQTQLKLYSTPHESAIFLVLELFDFAKSKGVTVFFVTGRQENQRELTIKNLNEIGFPNGVS